MLGFASDVGITCQMEQSKPVVTVPARAGTAPILRLTAQAGFAAHLVVILKK